MRILVFAFIFFNNIHSFESDYWFSFIAIQELQKKNFHVQYQPYFGLIECTVKPFELVPEMASQINFWECFILRLPHAYVQSPFGFVLTEDEEFIFEMLWGGQLRMLESLAQLQDHQISTVPGRVAVIANMGCQSYSHWLDEVLGRLALLEMHGVQYDWLYVPTSKKYMVETLQLWGIDQTKIIPADDFLSGVRAEELIVPSYVIDITDGPFKHIGLYVHPYTAWYVRNKLLQAVRAKNIQTNFSKRIFIARSDAPARHIINEDEIFNYVQQFGFERYELSKLSVTEQILLFDNAEIVIAAHGTGLVNSMFCKPGTKIVEIFQSLIDSSFWYLSHLFQLEYIPVATMPINKELFLDWTNHYDEYEKIWQLDTVVPMAMIEDVVEKLGLIKK